MAEDDEVVHEVDVFLSKELADHLVIFQYPVRPKNMSYDDAKFTHAKVKPKQAKVELELSMNTRAPTYDRSRGEQYAINADGRERSDDSYFNSSLMDKQVLVSSTVANNASNYAIGCISGGQLHLTPVKKAVQMRPNFAYLDKSDQKTAKEEKAKADLDQNTSQSESETEAKLVTVKFSKVETDRMKKAREKSFKTLEKRLNEEPWTDVKYHKRSTYISRVEREKLLCERRSLGEKLANYIPAMKYFEMLIPELPPTNHNRINGVAQTNDILSMAQLKHLPIIEQVKTILINASVIKYSQLQSLLSKDVDQADVLRSVQQVAMLVQGSWVVKSEFVYPKDTISPHSGVSAELLCRGRDYLMWKYTQTRYVTRKEITSVTKLPPEDVKDILEQMARVKLSRGWEFLMSLDSDFLQQYPDIDERQRLLWHAKHQQLVKILKLSGKTPPQSPTKQRPRHRSKSGGRTSGSEYSDTDTERKKSHRSRVNSAGSNSSPRARSKSNTPSRSVSGEVNNRLSPSKSLDSVVQPSIVRLQSPPKRPKVPEISIKHEPITPLRSVNGTVEIEQMDTSETSSLSRSVVNGPMSDELIDELTKFVKEKLQPGVLLKFKVLKDMLIMRIGELPSGHVLVRGVSDSALISGLRNAGAMKFNFFDVAEPMCALIVTGNARLDEFRLPFLELFKGKLRFAKKDIHKILQTTLSKDIELKIIEDLLKAYCVCGGGRFTLRIL